VGGVLSASLVVGPRPLRSPVSPPVRRRRSTHDPSPEQLLVGLGVGDVLSVAVGGRGGALLIFVCFGGVWAGQHDVARLRG
jgi:hypothetical protein